MVVVVWVAPRVIPINMKVNIRASLDERACPGIADPSMIQI
jgi:hypothetical protein